MAPWQFQGPIVYTFPGNTSHGKIASIAEQPSLILSKSETL